ncbi:MAG: branched-chain amino acid ABC transporter ATP-binding protein/permease [Bacteroidia bacterium]|jgi:ABC-type branched-subunit amino acid transport system ATPase component/ABC-type branched-subunit amino acid transport system permease subunit
MKALLWTALLLAGGAAALTLNGYFVYVLANVALLALVGVGLNLLMGLAGLVSFGHVGFYAIGAYTVAILTTKAGFGFWAAWPLAAAIAAAAGAALALPALRVKGPYLAMVTIAFGFIVEHVIVEARDLTGGQNGLMGIAAPALFGLKGERAIALLALAAAAVALAGCSLLSRGTWGAGWRAVRDAETAAESLGLNPLALKTAAFAISAACAGAAGALAAPLAGMVTPHSFGFGQSILFVLVVMIGGAGSVAGPVVGALVVGLLPELLAGLEDGRLLFFGVLLLVVLWVAPSGAAGLLQRWMKRKPKDAPIQPTAAPTLSQRSRRSLTAADLGKQFGGVRAVHELAFEARAGAVTSLIGPNGAGKTTALNLLSGFYAPDAGRFALGDTPLAGCKAWQIARSGIARSYQTSLLFGSLSVEDNVALGLARGRLGPLLGSQRLQQGREQARALLAWCGYAGRGDVLAADLPHVDRRLVEIARALATDPDALLLDEPAAGLSNEDKQQLATLLRRLADAGLTLLLVEHDMALVMGISDRVIVLDAGQRIATGTPAEVQADPAVQRAYLGEGLDRPAKARGESGSRHELLGVGELAAGYGAEPVLHSVALQVGRGEAVALLGANGAGKSTLMRSLAGLHRPVMAGGMHFDGHDIGRLGAEQIVALGLVLVPEGRQVFAELSVLDNLKLGAFLRPAAGDARIEAMLQRFPRLRERLQQRAGLLSGGEQQMLAIARALMAEPRLLLLDEPSLGLAPKVIAELFDALDKLRAEGLTLLVVDQMAALALALADRAYVIDSGHIVAQGSAAEIAADPALAQAYLGAAPAVASSQ